MIALLIFKSIKGMCVRACRSGGIPRAAAASVFAHTYVENFGVGERKARAKKDFCFVVFGSTKT